MLLSSSLVAGGLRCAVLVALALSLGWGTTPWFEAHAHSLAGVHDHAHDHGHMHGHVHIAARAGASAAEQAVGHDGDSAQEPWDAMDLGAGSPADSATDDSGSPWHLHTGVLLPGAALAPIDWALALDLSATDPRFPALPHVARSPGALEAPLRPPQSLS